MATPDVRVRLSAEGQREVIEALRAVQAEAAKAGAKTASSFVSANGVLAGLKNVAVQLGAALGVVQLVRFAQNAAESADEVGKMSQRVGASVENLSALRLASETADVPMEKLQAALAILARRTFEFSEGSPEAVKAFRDLGISAQQFKGKDTAQQFDIVAKAIGSLEDGPRKTALAFQVFGRQAVGIIPLLNDLSENGLQGAIDRARELGVLLSSETVAASQRLNDDLKLLSLQASALAANLIEGLEPALHEVITALGIDEGTTRSWRDFGHAIAVVVAVVRELGEAAAAAIFATVEVARGGVASLAALARGDAAEVDRIAADVRFKLRALEHDRERSQRERLKIIFGTNETAPVRKQSKLNEDDDTAGAAVIERKRLEAARAAAQDRLEIARTSLKSQTEDEKRNIEQSIVSLQDYYSQRRRLQKEEFDTEIAALTERRALEVQDPDQSKAARAVLSIDTEIQKKRIERAEESKKLALEEQQALRRNEDERLSALQKVRGLRGLDHQKALSEIQEEGRKFEEVLTRSGAAAPDARVQRVSFESQLTATVDFNEQLRRTEQELQRLELERSSIQNDLSAGRITEFEASRKILTVERSRKEQLQQMAESALVFARATGNPEAILQAEQLAERVRTLGESLDSAAAAMTRMRQAGREAFESGIGAVLRAARTDAEHLREDLISLLDTFLRVFEEIAAHNLAEKVLGAFKSPLPTQSLAAAAASGTGAVLGEKAVEGVEISAAAAPVAAGGTALVASAATVTAAGAALSGAAATDLAGGTALVGASAEIVGAGGALLGAAAALSAAAAALAASAATSAGGDVLKAATGHAAGGQIRGPGTGTSDSILARLSAGEYVVPARVVRQPGVLRLLESMRSERFSLETLRSHPGLLEGLRRIDWRIPELAPLPRFAEGGMVGAGAMTFGSDGAAGSAGAVGRDGRGLDGELRVKLGLGRGLVLEDLQTTEGQRVFVQLVGKNRRSIRSILGV